VRWRRCRDAANVRVSGLWFKMSGRELQESVRGPDPIWREPAQNEPNRRSRRVWMSILVTESTPVGRRISKPLKVRPFRFPSSRDVPAGHRRNVGGGLRGAAREVVQAQFAVTPKRGWCSPSDND
jgi:hypothetical protein